MIKFSMLVLFMAVSVLISDAQAAQPQWKFEKIDRGAPGNRMTDLKVAQDGTLHLVYTGCSDPTCADSELFHAFKSKGEKWMKASIDSKGKDTGWFPSLSLDERDGLHILYADHDKQLLRYANRDPQGQWNAETLVTSSKRGGWWTSSAWNDGTLYMAHTLLPKSGWEPAALELGTMKDGKWSFEIVDNNKNTGWFTSMAIDKAGNPVISYTMVFNQPVGALKLARKIEGSWDIMDIEGGVIKSHVITDSQGFIHLVYQRNQDDGSSALKYVTNSPDGEWKKTTIDDGKKEKIATGSFPRVATDSKGGIHIVYRHKDSELKYARNLGNGWDLRVIDAFGDSVYPWIVFDSSDNLHLSYEKASGITYGFCGDCAKP